LRGVLLLATAIVLASQRGISQAPDAAPVRLRDQASSIAQEIVGKLGLEPSGPVLVNVESSPWKTMMENAFIEALKNAGIKVLLGAVGQERELRIVVLDQSVTYQTIHSGGFQRLCRSVVEARMQRIQEVVTIGMFSRESIDTVAAKTDSLRSSEYDPGFFEQILGPLLIIAGSVTIIALLFTVRS
jgi:hypothetical protein